MIQILVFAAVIIFALVRIFLEKEVTEQKIKADRLHDSIDDLFEEVNRIERSWENKMALDVFIRQSARAERYLTVYRGRKVRVIRSNGNILHGMLVGKAIEKSGISGRLKEAFPFGIPVLIFRRLDSMEVVKIPMLSIDVMDAIGASHVPGTSSMIHYAKVLGIDPDFSEAELKTAFRELSKKYHPDKHIREDEGTRKENENEFKRISEAYMVCRTRFS